METIEMPKKGIAVLAALFVAGSTFALAQSGSQGPAGLNRPGEEEGTQSFCVERYARRYARLAYLEAKLSLTDQQKPLWAKWRQLKTDVLEKRRAACLDRKPGERKQLTALDREALIEKALSSKLQELQAAKPALQALYDGLTPEQKAIFDRGGRDHKGWGRSRHEGSERQERM